MKKNRVYVFLLALFLILSSVTVCGVQENIDSNGDLTLSPYFFIESEDAQVDKFPLKETNVTANINGVIADIYVVQIYANEGTAPINAKYVFPASTRAAVHGMKMEIGDNIITAQIREREEARQEFEQAKSEGKSASLLEQERPNVFTMSVANIMPGDTVRIELHYTEFIVSTDDVYEFVFPTVVMPRYSSQSANNAPQTDKWVASPYLKEGTALPGKYNITVNLSAGVPIYDIVCKSHTVATARESDSTAYVTLANPDDYAGNRDYILQYSLSGEEIGCGLSLQTGETENFFMLTIQPPERPEGENMLPREYIFILDVSGSMHGFPIETAKELLKDFVSGLRGTDTFNLILFDSGSIQMSPDSVSADAENIRRAIDMIEREFGGGGTELGSALERAAAIPMNENTLRNVVVITDGAIDTEQSIFDIISSNLENTSYFAFGIGSSVNRYLVEGIGKVGLGESFVATEPSEVPDVADRFRKYIESPVLTGVNVTYTGFDAYDIESSNQQTLFARRPIVLFGKWRGELTGSVQITGKRGNTDYVQEIQLSGIEMKAANTAINYLWARKKVERLADYRFNWEDAETVKKEVTEIGLRYSMMTEYTSFVAVLDTIRNGDKESLDVNQPLPLPLGVSNYAVGAMSVSEDPYVMSAPSPVYAPMTGDDGLSLAIYCFLCVISFAVIVAAMRRAAGTRFFICARGTHLCGGNNTASKLPLRENIGIGDIERINDGEQMTQILDKRI